MHAAVDTGYASMVDVDSIHRAPDCQQQALRSVALGLASFGAWHARVAPLSSVPYMLFWQLACCGCGRIRVVILVGARATTKNGGKHDYENHDR